MSRWSEKARRKFRSPEYRAWTMMKTRCYNANNHKYPAYGGRGIEVCDRWRGSFETFLEDMGPRPGKGYSIDRIDNDSNYEPSNCRWATASQQASNRGSTRWIEVKGERRTLQEWAAMLGAHSQTIADRITRGWSIEDAVSVMPGTRYRKDGVLLVYRGKTKSLAEWGRVMRLRPETISTRIKAGWSIGRALTASSMRGKGSG